MFGFGHKPTSRHSRLIATFARPENTIVHTRAIYKISMRGGPFGPPRIATIDHYVMIVENALMTDDGNPSRLSPYQTLRLAQRQL